VTFARWELGLLAFAWATLFVSWFVAMRGWRKAITSEREAIGYAESAQQREQVLWEFYERQERGA
jgi:hypothetical protein